MSNLAIEPEFEQAYNGMSSLPHNAQTATLKSQCLFVPEKSNLY